MSDVAELLLKPRELLSILPLQVEIRSLQGSNIIAYINAFGFKGEAALGVTVSRTPEKIMVRYDVIGEILFGRYIPPRSELSLTITASKSGDSATEIVFEVFVRSSFLKELSLSKEVDTLLSGVPDVFTSAMRRLIEGREVEQRAVAVSMPSKPNPVPPKSLNLVPLLVGQQRQQ